MGFNLGKHLKKAEKGLRRAILPKAAKAPTINTGAQDALTTISRAEIERYNEYTKPLEDKLQGMVDNPDYEGNYDRGLSLVDGAFGASAGKKSRTLERYGVTQTGAEASASTRKNNLSKGLARIQAKNSIRMQTKQQQESARQALLGVGTDQYNKAVGLYTAAATNDANRDATNRAIAAQENASNNQLIGTGLGAVAAFAV